MELRQSKPRSILLLLYNLRNNRIIDFVVLYLTKLWKIVLLLILLLDIVGVNWLIIELILKDLSKLWDTMFFFRLFLPFFFIFLRYHRWINVIGNLFELIEVELLFCLRNYWVIHRIIFYLSKLINV